MIYPDDFLNKIICGDVLATLKDIPTASVGLSITSPPYNLKNSTGNGLKKAWKCGKWQNAALVHGYADHEDCMPHDKYVEWQRACITEIMRVLKEDGAFFYNHKWRVQNGLLQDRQDIVSGFPVRQIIIWKRKGGLNFNAGYFLPTYEVIYLIAKPKFKLAQYANKIGDVWDITQEMSSPHPAPFPLELVETIIKSTTADTILDPFMGSGTTAVAAMKQNRNYIGIELSADYCEFAKKRIAYFEKEKKDYLLENKRKARKKNKELKEENEVNVDIGKCSSP